MPSRSPAVRLLRSSRATGKAWRAAALRGHAIWRSEVLARGMNPNAVEHLSELWRTFRGYRDRSHNFEVTDTIEDLGGVKPRTFEAFIREQLAS